MGALIKVRATCRCQAIFFTMLSYQDTAWSTRGGSKFGNNVQLTGSKKRSINIERSTIVIRMQTNKRFIYTESSTDKKFVRWLLSQYSLKFEYMVGVPLVLIILEITIFFPAEVIDVLTRIANRAILYFKSNNFNTSTFFCS